MTSLSRHRIKRQSAHTRPLTLAGRCGAVLLSVLALSACVTNGDGSAEGIGFREARFKEMSAMQGYRSCVEDAVTQAESARKRANAAGYLGSARLLEKCESDLGPEASQLASEERMQAYALGIINYIRGGDIASARKNLDVFKKAFPGQDLSLPDGASFIDTASVLTAGVGAEKADELALMNVSRGLRGEFNRARFWKRN